ncbi:MaoC/PaaZ C-terminal domain-containing protein [Kitasatospora sp. NPDC101176]|uniref:MaoC/PaaZ C-terminal domain-containing protein n=1 Tax=Kitasatospora sp. NPDC101176 TaxID=3364099 RepID=UPI0037F75772
MTTTAPPARRARHTLGAEDLAAYRAAARTRLPAATGAAPSPAQPFVLAHTLAQQSVADLTAGDVGFTGVVHLGQEIRTHHRLSPATTVLVEVALTAVRREARGTRLALATRISDDTRGTLLAELSTAALLVGVTTLEPFGTPAPAAHPGTTADTEPLTLTHTLTRADVAAYAHASGDLNPIHLDDTAARAAGFPGVIAHGMHLVALAAEEITDRHAGGDPARITALGARFAAPLAPGAALRLTLQPYDRATVVRFSVATDTGTAVKAGWATLAGE